MQRYIRQVFFIVPKHKWTLFSFPSLFIKTLAITAPWIPEVFYLSLFSVLSSCNKIYLSGISCSASRFFFFPSYCWDNVSFPPPAVNCVCWRGPEHSFSFVLPFTTYLETITEQICKPPEWLRNLGTWLFKNNYLREVSSEVSDHSHYNHPLWLQHGISELPAINNR